MEPITIDEFNAAIALLVGLAILVGWWLSHLVDPVRRLLRIARMTLAFRLDRGLGYDLGRAFRAARRHA